MLQKIAQFSFSVLAGQSLGAPKQTTTSDSDYGQSSDICLRYLRKKHQLCIFTLDNTLIGGPESQLETATMTISMPNHHSDPSVRESRAFLIIPCCEPRGAAQTSATRASGDAPYLHLSLQWYHQYDPDGDIGSVF
jgi:hypothetical protein